jgi:hypothetical protein
LILTSKKITPAGVELTVSINRDERRSERKDLDKDDDADASKDMAELLRNQFMPEENCKNYGKNGHGPEEDLSAEAREKKHVEPFALVTTLMGEMPVMRPTLTYEPHPKCGYHYSTCVS